MGTRFRLNFMKYRLIAITLSTLFIVAGLIEIQFHGLKYSVDFTGGILVHLRFTHPVSTGEVRNALKSVNLSDSLIQEFGSPQDISVRVAQEKAKKLIQEGGKTQEDVPLEAFLENISVQIQNALHEYFLKEKKQKDYDFNTTSLKALENILVREDPLGLKSGKNPSAHSYSEIAKKLYTARMDLGGVVDTWEDVFAKADVPQKVKELLKEKFDLGPFTIMQIEFVGPQVGRELKEKTRLAIIFALIGMLLYIWFRFDLVFGITAVICLVHDFLFTLSAFSLFDREISLTVVAAFLTIIGYSLNDTIVVYDRIRENMNKRRFTDIVDLYNTSINETLSRTLLTSLTTLFVVVILYLFGGKVINDFAFALLVGVLVGTYSSIYVASSLASYWQEYRKKKVKSKVTAKKRTPSPSTKKA